MIINPIIPIWLMGIYCIIILILLLYKKSKKDIKNNLVKILIVILLFTINLRPMVPTGEVDALSYDMNVLFVIDKSVSMRALDYNGENERFEGVISDCCNIVNQLSGCKFSIITFGDDVKKEIPFTIDSDMVQAELKAINLENDTYAKGSSINSVNGMLEEMLKEQKEKDNKNTVLFFVSDGEITIDSENLRSFANIKQYVSNGAVLGYGTAKGGKMVSDLYRDEPNSPYYYVYYYDENYKKTTAISKIDENNLKQISSDIGIDYIHMEKASNIEYKLSEVKKQALNSLNSKDKIDSYKDIYYYLGIILVILLFVDFDKKKRRLK